MRDVLQRISLEEKERLASKRREAILWVLFVTPLIIIMALLGEWIGAIATAVILGLVLWFIKLEASPPFTASPPPRRYYRSYGWFYDVVRRLRGGGY